MDKEFRKDRLNNGCIVQIRNGKKYIYIEKAKRNGVHENMLVDIKTGCWIRLVDYNDDLIEKYGDSEYDIIKICDMDDVGDNIEKHIINDTDEWTAEREENEKEDLKEMIEEIIEKVDKIAATLKN